MRKVTAMDFRNRRHRITNSNNFVSKTTLFETPKVNPLIILKILGVIDGFGVNK
jgi:hypothetical protein